MTEVVQHKTLRPVGLKVAGGHVEAVFSAFGNVDLDDDIVMPGAVEDGIQIVVSAWNHASWQPGILPLGRGVIRTSDAEATVLADFFSTSAASDTLEVLRGLGEMCQWSFGFRILEAEHVNVDGGKRVQLLHRLDVTEASPVLLGSNPLTHTVSVSGGDSADEALAREYARFTAGELDRQMAAEMDAIRAGL
ncbi:MAG: HK97 family phage prohead protease [Actinomycetota bacterium]|nr:HK97 family phage prohead protease [Actinomycetota bacterium]